MAIIVSDMRKSFHGVTALDSISFMVADGEFFSLLGPRKSGKSTVIACLSTLTNPDSGLVEINGRTLGATDESVATDMGVIFESIFLDLNLTVRGNISFHAALHGLTDEGINDLATRLDITHILNRRLGSVSIGEQRRVDLARALVHSPRVLLLDEPVKGLDPHSTSVIWRVIREEHEQGTTILMVTEDSGAAIHADRVGILIDGKVLAAGAPRSLIADYCPSTLQLRLVNPIVSRHELASVGMEMPDPNANGEVELQLDSAAARDVIALLGDQVLHFEFRTGTLEEVVRVLSGRSIGTDDVRRESQRPDIDNTPDDPEELDEDNTHIDDEYWDDRVIAPIWSDDEETNDPWDDDVYVHRNVHEQKSVIDDDSQADQWWDDDEQWDPPKPVEEHWRKAHGFADTGRRAEYSVHRTDDFEDEDELEDPSVNELEDLPMSEFEDPLTSDFEDLSMSEFDDVDSEAADDQGGIGRAFQDDAEQPSLNRDYLGELNEVIWEEQQRASHADQLDRLAIVSRLLEDAVLSDPLPPFDEKFPIDQLPFVARDFAAPKPRRTTWYEEMRRPINEEMAKQARVKLAVEKRIEEARRRRDEQGEAT